MWRDGVCSNKSDIWALGCVVYELLTHVPPFDAPELAYKVIGSDPRPLPPAYSEELRRVVLEKMLQKDPTRRSDMTQLLTEPYINQAVVDWMHVSSQPWEGVHASVKREEWNTSALALISWY